MVGNQFGLFFSNRTPFSEMPYLSFKSLPLHPPTFLTPLTFNVILNSTSLLTKTSAFKSKAKNTTNKETEKNRNSKKATTKNQNYLLLSLQNVVVSVGPHAEKFKLVSNNHERMQKFFFPKNQICQFKLKLSL